MLKKNITLAIAICLALTACVTDNPRQGGFFGGLGGMSSGAYDQRVQKRQNELSDQQGTNTRLKQESNELGAEVRFKEHALESEHQRVAKMEGELKQLETDIERTDITSAQQKKELSSLKEKIDKLKLRMQTQQSAYVDLDHDGGCNTNAVRCKVLEQERNHLAEEYKKLSDYYLALSQAAN